MGFSLNELRLGQPIPDLAYPVLIAMLVLGSLLTWLYQRTVGKNLAFWV
jgi:hypothetical protein